MVIVLEGPRPFFDVLLQNYIRDNWPTTGDPDLTRLQTTRNMIDWGKDYDEQTSQRCSIKVADIDSRRQGSEVNARMIEYGATCQIKIQYRDADDDQPPELMNIGEEVGSLAFRADVTQALRPNGIHNIRVGNFSREDNAEGIQELHQYIQEVTIYFWKVGKEI